MGLHYVDKRKFETEALADKEDWALREVLCQVSKGLGLRA